MASRYKHTNRSREEGCGSPRSCASVDFAIAQSRILLLVETAVRMQIVCESPSKILILSCWSVVALHFVRGGRILLKSVAEFWRATLICMLVTECKLQRVGLSHLLVVGDFSHSSWRTVTFAKLPANFRLSSDSEENSEDVRILLLTVSLLKMCDFVRGQIVNSILYCARVRASSCVRCYCAYCYCSLRVCPSASPLCMLSSYGRVLVCRRFKM